MPWKIAAKSTPQKTEIAMPTRPGSFITQAAMTTIIGISNSGLMLNFEASAVCRPAATCGS